MNLSSENSHNTSLDRRRAAQLYQTEEEEAAVRTTSSVTFTGNVNRHAQQQKHPQQQDQEEHAEAQQKDASRRLQMMFQTAVVNSDEISSDKHQKKKASTAAAIRTPASHLSGPRRTTATTDRSASGHSQSTSQKKPQPQYDDDDDNEQPNDHRGNVAVPRHGTLQPSISKRTTTHSSSPSSSSTKNAGVEYPVRLLLCSYPSSTLRSRSTRSNNNSAYSQKHVVEQRNGEVETTDSARYDPYEHHDHDAGGDALDVAGSAAWKEGEEEDGDESMFYVDPLFETQIVQILQRSNNNNKNSRPAATDEGTRRRPLVPPLRLERSFLASASSGTTYDDDDDDGEGDLDQLPSRTATRSRRPHPSHRTPTSTTPTTGTSASNRLSRNAVDDDDERNHNTSSSGGPHRHEEEEEAEEEAPLMFRRSSLSSTNSVGRYLSDVVSSRVFPQFRSRTRDSSPPSASTSTRGCNTVVLAYGATRTGKSTSLFHPHNGAARLLVSRLLTELEGAAMSHVWTVQVGILGVLGEELVHLLPSLASVSPTAASWFHNSSNNATRSGGVSATTGSESFFEFARSGGGNGAGGGGMGNSSSSRPSHFVGALFQQSSVLLQSQDEVERFFSALWTSHYHHQQQPFGMSTLLSVAIVPARPTSTSRGAGGGNGGGAMLVSSLLQDVGLTCFVEVAAESSTSNSSSSASPSSQALAKLLVALGERARYMERTASAAAAATVASLAPRNRAPSPPAVVFHSATLTALLEPFLRPVDAHCFLVAHVNESHTHRTQTRTTLALLQQLQSIQYPGGRSFPEVDYEVLARQFAQRAAKWEQQYQRARVTWRNERRSLESDRWMLRRSYEELQGETRSRNRTEDSSSALLQQLKAEVATVRRQLASTESQLRLQSELHDTAVERMMELEEELRQLRTQDKKIGGHAKTNQFRDNNEWEVASSLLERCLGELLRCGLIDVEWPPYTEGPPQNSLTLAMKAVMQLARQVSDRERALADLASAGLLTDSDCTFMYSRRTLLPHVEWQRLWEELEQHCVTAADSVETTPEQETTKFQNDVLRLVSTTSLLPEHRELSLPVVKPPHLRNSQRSKTNNSREKPQLSLHDIAAGGESPSMLLNNFLGM